MKNFKFQIIVFIIFSFLCSKETLGLVTKSKGKVEYKNFSSTEEMLENQKVLDKAITSFKPEIVIHLAAQAGVRHSISNPEIY